MYVVRNERKSMLFSRLSWIGFFGMMIILLLNVASTLPKGQQIFFDVSRSAASGYQELMQGAGEISEKNIDSAQSFFVSSQIKFQEAADQIWFFTFHATSS